MPTLTLTLSGANGKTNDWAHVSTPLGQIQTLINTTGLDYLNLQTNGVRTTNIRTHAGADLDNVKVRNDSGGAISADKIVYVSGHHDDGTDVYPEITQAITTTTATTTFYGFGVTTAAIGNGSDGTIRRCHEVSSIDTSGYTVHQKLWLSRTAGAWTSVLPAAPNFAQPVGHVTKVDASNGRILLFPQTPIPWSIADQI